MTHLVITDENVYGYLQYSQNNNIILTIHDPYCTSITLNFNVNVAEAVIEFNCYCPMLIECPDLSILVNLVVLKFGNGKLVRLHNSISNIESIRYLFCSRNHLIELPNLSRLTMLRGFLCDRNKLNTLPNSLSELTNLKFFSCAYNNLDALPDLSLTNLESLDCYNNNLNTLPNLPISLKELYCYNNKLTILPDLSNFLDLNKLSFGNNKLSELQGLSTLTHLIEVDCQYNDLNVLPNLPDSVREIKISIDQIDLLINDDYTPTDALNTLNANSEIIINDIVELKLIEELPRENENRRKFYYDKILNEEKYKNIIKKYHIKLNILKQIRGAVNESRLIKFKQYVHGIITNLKLRTELYNNESYPDPNDNTKQALSVFTMNQFVGGKKSKKSKKSMKSKKSKKTKKSKKSKKTKKNIKRRKSVKL
jgi:Leucine-rich repeat (LRR) protein